MSNILYAGYGKENITPDFDVCLAGYGNDIIRPAMGVEQQIYVTCVAVRNEEKTFLIYTMDGLSAHESIAAILRERLAEAGCDVPGEQVFLSATHCHSCPRIYLGTPGAEEFRELFFSQAVKAGLNAIADLAPAQMQLAQKDCVDLTFVRHYLMKDGSWAGINFGKLVRSEIADYATKADNTMIMLKFAREGKQDIMMLNFQAHPALSYQIGRYIISADWVGRMRDQVAKETGALVAYYNGASGNQITRSFLVPGAEPFWFEYAKKVAAHALSLVPELKPVEGTQMENVHLMYETQIDHSLDHLVPQCQEIADMDQKQGRKDEADQKAWALGLGSCYVAGMIVMRAGKPATAVREMNAFRIGPVGFTTGTYEMSSDAGIYVRANSPFKNTFILCANSGYIPTANAIDNHTYEGDTTMEIRGTAEAMAEKYVEMLNQVK